MPQCAWVRIELQGIAPPIWRSFAVPTAITMHQLGRKQAGLFYFPERECLAKSSQLALKCSR